MEQEKKKAQLEEPSLKDREAPKKVVSLSAQISCEAELALGKEKANAQR